MTEVAEFKTNYQSGARDVQYNPTTPETFASAYEQNTIEVCESCPPHAPARFQGRSVCPPLARSR